MTTQLPSWTALEPDAPPTLSPEEGHVVALVSLQGAHEDGTSAELAAELARAWSSSGHRVVLADLGLAEPSLEDLLGLEAEDGVSDAVAFGASVGRVARAVDDFPFFFIGPGTAVADPSTFLDHPRWKALCQGFQEAGATLVAFVPWGEKCRAHVLAQATDVVLLGTPEDDASEVAPALDGRPLAFVGRPAEAGADAPLPEPGPDEGEVSEPVPDEAPPASEATGEAEEPALEAVTPFEDPFAVVDEDTPAGEEAPAVEEPGTTEGDDFVPLDDEVELDALGVAEEAGEPGETSDDAEPSPSEGAGEPGEASGPAEPMEPEPAAPQARHPAPSVEEPSADGRGEVPLADEILAEAGDAPEAAHSVGEAPGPEVVAARTTRSKGGGRRTTLLVLLLVLLAGAAAAWWFGLVEVPGLPAPGATSAVPPAETVQPLEAAEPAAPGTAEEAAASTAAMPREAAGEPAAETAPPAAWAVQLEAHQDRGMAWRRAEALASAAPGHLWFTVPVEVDGTLYHRVLVGAAPGQEEVAALVEEVAGELGVTSAGWVYRATPLAYRLDEASTLEEARDRASELRALELPAYVLGVPYDDGSTGYRIYAGAYPDAASAAALGALLDAQGLPDHALVQRTGLLPE